MSNTEEYFNQFDAIAVKELDDEVAATIQGGKYDLQVYKDPNFQNLLGELNLSPGRLPPKLDNQISSIKINNGRWRFSDLPNEQGLSVTFDPGSYQVLPKGIDDKTSSIIRVD